MKRELKENAIVEIDRGLESHKANPYEKGTERRPGFHHPTGFRLLTKLIPMKRELKAPGASLTPSCSSWLTKLIPMKRELKAWTLLKLIIVRSILTKLIPMKRELKVLPASRPPGSCSALTKLIPMKRELKESLAAAIIEVFQAHKANPYEKGTES